MGAGRGLQYRGIGESKSRFWSARDVEWDVSVSFAFVSDRPWTHPSLKNSYFSNNSDQSHLLILIITPIHSLTIPKHLVSTN